MVLAPMTCDAPYNDLGLIQRLLRALTVKKWRCKQWKVAYAIAVKIWLDCFYSQVKKEKTDQRTVECGMVAHWWIRRFLSEGSRVRIHFKRNVGTLGNYLWRFGVKLRHSIRADFNLALTHDEEQSFTDNEWVIKLYTVVFLGKKFGNALSKFVLHIRITTPN